MKDRRETGLKPDTLRAWERRYGLPQPQRTDGGHRLYSQRDIDTLKWLVARQEEGLSISRAVELWHKLADEGQNPWQSAEDLTSPLPEYSTRPVGGEALAELAQAWLSACLDFDETRAEQILNQALALYPVETVCLDLIQPVLAEIGQNWYQDKVTVQQEHFASALAMRRLEALLTASPAPTRSRRILLGCPPDEEHVFVSLLLTLLLRRRGWDVVYLGASVPVERMQATIASVKPSLVILVAQRLSTAATLYQMGQMLSAEGAPLAYGGRIFLQLPALRERIPGYFLGEDIGQVTRQVEAWLMSPQPLPSAEQIRATSPAYQAAHRHFLERQGMIEAEIWQQWQYDDTSADHLRNANQHMARNMIAALQLGDLTLLDSDIAWIAGLLDNYGLPADALRHYLWVYYQAARHHLEPAGQPVVDWLANLTQANNMAS